MIVVADSIRSLIFQSREVVQNVTLESSPDDLEDHGIRT